MAGVAGYAEEPVGVVGDAVVAGNAVDLLGGVAGNAVDLVEDAVELTRNAVAGAVGGVDGDAVVCVVGLVGLKTVGGGGNAVELEC